MGAFETIEARLQLSADGFNAAIGNAVNSLGTLQNKAGGAHKAMGALGVGMAAVAAGGIAKSVGASMDLQSALNESQAIMGDLTQNEMKAMETAAREVGKTTTFSAEEAGGAFYYLASAGMDAEQSVASMGDVAQFAQAGAFDLATATDLATDAQSALGMSSDDAAENAQNLNQVMDVLVKSNTLANASVEEFSQSLTNKAAAAMRQVGMEVEEGASALAVFADQGLKGNRAGTILARTIEGLQQAAQENAGAFEELGIAVYDADGNMRPMADIVEDMDTAMADMSQEQKNAAMAQLGLNERAAQGINLLSGNTDQMREYEGELQNAGGTAEEVANNQLQSLSAQWDILKSQITDIGIGIGNHFLPPLTGLVSMLSDAVSVFVRVNDATDGWLATLSLVGTLVGGLAIAAGSASAVLGAGGFAMAATAAAGAVGGLATALGILTGPIGLAIGAAVLLGAAWKSNFGGIRDHTQRVVDVFNEEFGPAIQWLKNLVSTLLPQLGGGGGLSGMFATLSQKIGPLISLIADGLIWAIRGLADVTRATIAGMKEAWVTLGPIVSSVVDGILTTLDILYVTFRGLFRVAMNVWQGNWHDAWMGIFNTFADIAGRIIGFIDRNFMPGFADAMAGKLGEMRAKWELWGQNLLTTVKDAFNRVKELITGVMNTLRSIFGPYLLQLRTMWATFSMQILGEARLTWNAIKAAISPVLDWIRTSIPPVLTAIQQKWQQFKAIVVPIVRTLASVVRTVLGAMMSFAKTVIRTGLNVINRVWSVFGDDIKAATRMLADTVMTVIRQLMDTIKTVIIVGLRLIRGDWSGAWDAIKGYVTRTTDRIKTLVSGWVDVIVGYFRTLKTDAVGLVRDMMDDVIQTIKNKLSDAKQAGKDFVNSFADGIKSVAGKPGKAAKKMAGGVRDKLTRSDAKEGPLSDLSKTGPALVKTFANGITSATRRAIRAIKKLVSAVRRYLPGSDAETGPLSDIASSGRALIETWAAAIESRTDLAKAAAGKVADAASSALVLAEDGSMVPSSFYDKPAKPKKKMVRAEDGSMVPASFYDKPAKPKKKMVRAEDGSMVPKSFYANSQSESAQSQEVALQLTDEAQRLIELVDEDGNEQEAMRISAGNLSL